MIVTVFRSRLFPATEPEYAVMASKMSALAASTPGYVSHKGFVAPDGERLTLVEFETEQGLRAWAAHPGHVDAKRAGRERFFLEYKVQICRLMRQTSGPAGT